MSDIRIVPVMTAEEWRVVSLGDVADGGDELVRRARCAMWRQGDRDGEASIREDVRELRLLSEWHTASAVWFDYLADRITASFRPSSP